VSGGMLMTGEPNQLFSENAEPKLDWLQCDLEPAENFFDNDASILFSSEYDERSHALSLYALELADNLFNEGSWLFW
jgi:hypothetical protein